MCVIIVRDPGIIIPHAKLESACIVNPDGWGLAVADRGKLVYRHEMKNDPEVIAKALEDAKNHYVLLHLRFTTKGEKILENCHPFKVTTHEQHGLDIAFAHNGTLYKYAPSDKDNPYSDSHEFNSDYLQPFVARSAALYGLDKVFDDQFMVDCLEDQAGSNSKFALLDGNGRALIINHGEGKEFEGWWSSNEYSFQRNHRTPTYTTHHWPNSSTTTSRSSLANAYDSGCAYGGYSDYDDSWQAHVKEADEAAQALIDTADSEEKQAQRFEPTEEEEETFYDTKEQCQMVGSVIDGCKNPRLNKKLIDHLLAKKNPRFCELAAIDSLLEVTKLDPEDIAELVSFYPEASVMLIQELLFELYLKHSMAAKQQQAA